VSLAGPVINRETADPHFDATGEHAEEPHAPTSRGKPRLKIFEATRYARRSPQMTESDGIVANHRRDGKKVSQWIERVAEASVDQCGNGWGAALGLSVSTRKDHERNECRAAWAIT
jgi:hypothetical protein